MPTLGDEREPDGLRWVRFLMGLEENKTCRSRYWLECALADDWDVYELGIAVVRGRYPFGVQ